MVVDRQTESNVREDACGLDRVLATVAMIVAGAAVAGSLWLSLGLGLKACPLCLYQRSFVAGVLAILLLSWLHGSAFLVVGLSTAVPLAIAAVGIAGFHVALEATHKLECPPGLWGMGSAPQQSLAVLGVLAVILLLASLRSKATAAAAGLTLGLALAYASVASAPPMPPAPSKPYDSPLDQCRPPFVAVGEPK